MNDFRFFYRKIFTHSMEKRKKYKNGLYEIQPVILIMCILSLPGGSTP